VRQWLLACILLAGCGGGQEVAEPNGDGLIVAYEAGNHLYRYGGRVFGDGRYELYSTAQQTGPAPWKSYDAFTPEQVDEIGAAVDRALDANIPDHVPGSDPPPPDAPSATFTLKGRTIKVDEWPKAAPAELERILERIAQLRKRPPVPSTWRVWSNGKVVELEARCEIAEVPALRPLRDALFRTTAPPASGRPAEPDPPDTTPLVAIFFDAPKGQETLEVFADGRRIDRVAGTDKTRELSTDQLAAIRAALENTDWAALPSRLC
jgi:hypothetical protein